MATEKMDADNQVSRYTDVNDDEHSEEKVAVTASGQKVVVEDSKVTTKALTVAAGVTIGGFLFGYDIGVISGCLIMPDFFRRFEPAGATELSSQNASLITSLLSAGTFFGALAQGPISDRLGRKPALMLWAIIFFIGAILQVTTFNSIAQIVVGRFVAGLGVGALSGLCPLYLGETAPAYIRGSIVAGYQLNIIFGIVISYGITWATSTRAHDSSLSWRIPVGFQLLWAIILFGVMLLLPESPRWLIARNRHGDARQVMAEVRGTDLQTLPTGELRGDPALERDFDDMAEGIELEKAAFAGTNWLTAWVKCFSTKQKMWYRTGLGMMLQTLQQLNGQNFYYYYGPVFFSKAAVSLNAYQIQFMFGAVSFVCTIPALYLVERIGRRSSLLIGSFGEFACAFIVAFVGHYALAPSLPDGSPPPPDTLTSAQKNAGNAFIAFAVFHLALFSMFWGPVPWITLSEMYPSPLRARCISLGSASNWFWNFMLSYFSNKIAAQYQSFIMLIFGSILFVSGIFVYFCLPEVRGLTLEQVDDLFESGVSPWRSASWVPTKGNTNRNMFKRGEKAVRRLEA
ncbi:putative monosaccharide transporter [Tilletiaria anomala UBC 951]|uniref:Putative monosaccharide transporter n=1 Tax=Tilletiaria anomala (strain ATCC 24038 / CBS 436.72 / UBC 951) TaxID=1037660 RepID=A0A066WI06_TILAU|nr:putative monosaccharide transporter [Tilletiaria anomala UBC 951]KDN53436.1 putative monosaccharide transporter [Tilletiaria anomala UBC 951]